MADCKGIPELHYLINKKVVAGRKNPAIKAFNNFPRPCLGTPLNILNIKLSPGIVYTVYLTSAGSCPFNASQRYFMVRMDDEKVDVVVAHEMLHIEFIRNFGFYCRDVLKLTVEDFGAFQEASTFLLNDEMNDILSRPDYGYKEHQELRSKLSAEWKKNKNFNNLVNYYKGLTN
ncbi:MAG: hypothetical protein A2606_02030 [Candidatus Yanofskybacteria bacterium RIFOXYD1_FULL_42_10]|uniref:Uncharacterized protein n=1 Tax=Candidatus Yanofskybacteria bacterium RIFOXYD1_FULL_42_10 TaxID=1802718 RepID=A0A1F8HUH3_9BACT|nr:MAG: hypothetical protein A2606_02030 [Candidatus Yanofskybacteria bacterium RIFOXYD1_FULL_42_10]